MAVTVSCPTHILSLSFLRNGIGTLILFRAAVCSAESLYFLDSHSHEWLMRYKQKTRGEIFLKGADLATRSTLLPLSFFCGTQEPSWDNEERSHSLRKVEQKHGNGLGFCDAPPTPGPPLPCPVDVRQ